jgi:hypothetical protein
LSAEYRQGSPTFHTCVQTSSTLDADYEVADSSSQ